MLLDLITEVNRRQRRWKIRDFTPQTWQSEWMEKTNDRSKNEFAFLCANQIGKTLGVVAFLIPPLTGLYDEFPWYTGRRWNEPINVIWASETYQYVRDTGQDYLCGPFEVFENEKAARLAGTGWIPGELISRVVRLRNPNDCIDKLFVNHISGGLSVVHFKAYSQGYRAFGGIRAHIVVPDEDPSIYDPRIYDEMKKRTQTTDGIILCPMTPTGGMTTVVTKFYPAPGLKNQDLIQKTIWDADDWVLSQERKKQIWDETDPMERPCRCEGEPFQGSGKIFAIPKESYIRDRIPLSMQWRYGIGIDFGSANTGACFAAYDEYNDIFYAFGEYQQTNQTIQTNALAIRDKMKHYARMIGVSQFSPADWPCAYGNDGNQTQDEDCQTLADQWRKYDMKLMADPCHLISTKTDDKGGVKEVRDFHRGPMLDEMRQAFCAGKLIVFNDCYTLLRQIDFYHKENGKIIKVNDHVLDACRHIYIMRKHMEYLTVTKKNQYDDEKEITEFDPIRCIIG